MRWTADTHGPVCRTCTHLLRPHLRRDVAVANRRDRHHRPVDGSHVELAGVLADGVAVESGGVGGEELGGLGVGAGYKEMQGVGGKLGDVRGEKWDVAGARGGR